MKPGVYPGLPMQAYLDLPAVSSSIIRDLIERCPRAAWHASWLNPHRERESTDAQDAGTIAHGILLEGSTAGVEVIDPADHPAEKTGAIPDGWTNKSIRTARDNARAAGKIPVLKDDMIRIRAMVDSARAFIDSLRDTEPAVWAAFQPDGGESETTIVWQDGRTLCRIRPDRLSADRRLMIDAKFTATSAEPSSWGRTQMTRMGYYQSAAFYRRGVAAAFDVEEAAYHFLVVETEPPHLCSLVGVDPEAFALGAEKVAAGLSLWQQCVREDHWPAYPNRAVYPELPAYESARWQERQGCDEHGIPFDLDKLFPRKEVA